MCLFVPHTLCEYIYIIQDQLCTCVHEGVYPALVSLFTVTESKFKECASARVCATNSWAAHMCNSDVTAFSNRCKFDACVYL